MNIMNNRLEVILGFVLIGSLLILFAGCGGNIPTTLDINDIHTSMSSGVIIDYASYCYPGFWRGLVLVNDSKTQVDLAEEPGVDFVRFDIRNEVISSSTEMAKLDQIIGYVRLKDLKIYIGAYGMETYYNWENMFNFPYGGSGRAIWEKCIQTRQVI